jgi:hypothetical protein
LRPAAVCVLERPWMRPRKESASLARISISRQLPSNYCTRRLQVLPTDRSGLKGKSDKYICIYISKLGRLKVSAQIKPGSKSISVYFCSRGKAAQRKLLWTCLATFNGHGKVDIRKIAKKGGARTRSSWTVPAGRSASSGICNANESNCPLYLALRTSVLQAPALPSE